MKQRNRDIQIGKGKPKQFLFANEMIIHVEMTGSTKRLIELIREFSNVARFQINTLKSILLLYSSNENQKLKILNII